MVFQFIPLIRKKCLIFHRINGYIVTILLLLGTAAAFMIMRRSFGGAVSTQASVGLLGVMVVVSLGMAMYNIKRLQIEQHRAWMLRTMFYCGTIITLRLIMIIAAQLMPLASNYYSVMRCDMIATLTNPRQFRKSYPQCFTQNGTTDGWIPVVANFSQDAVTVGAALELGYSMAVSHHHYTGTSLSIADDYFSDMACALLARRWSRALPQPHACRDGAVADGQL